MEFAICLRKAGLALKWETFESQNKKKNGTDEGHLCFIA